MTLRHGTPWALLLLPAVLIFLYVPRQGHTAWLQALPLILTLVLAAGEFKSDTRKYLSPYFTSGAAEKTCWSPYYRIDVDTVRPTQGVASVENGIRVHINRMFQQYFIRDAAITGGLPEGMRTFLDLRARYYALPYSLKPAPHSVLILGAGTGQDVLEAVKHGARDIDAVEIDPEIIKLGRTYNPAYSRPEVRIHCGDARNFVERASKKYDLIVFSFLDSLSLPGDSFCT